MKKSAKTKIQQIFETEHAMMQSQLQIALETSERSRYSFLKQEVDRLNMLEARVLNTLKAEEGDIES